MVENLCIFYGDKICTLDGKDYHAFPEVEQLAKPGVDSKLRSNGFGYRAPFIQKSAEKIVANGGEDWLYSLTKMDYNEAKQALITLPGIGAKVQIYFLQAFRLFSIFLYHFRLLTASV